jgi:4-amino-4-deoxy-L-arabinose transferase-like glycosyltransferase
VNSAEAFRESPAPRACAGPLAKWAVAAAAALFLLQIVAADRLELTFDEAYYVLWSRHLAWGYLDHPPMVAFVIRASTALFGASELGVRALSGLSVGALPALVALIAWRLFRSAEVAAVAALTWVAMPLVAASFIVTPDAPLVVFWTLGLAALVELWRSGKAGWLWAIGVALGLALMSKFTAAFFGLGVALALIATPSLRQWLRSPHVLAAVAITAAIVSPFVAWNAEHGWATFAKQLGRTSPHDFAPRYLLEFVAAQIGLVNPLQFAPLVLAFAGVRWRPSALPTSDEEARILLVSTLAPAVLYFAFHALHDRVQGNWLAPLYPAAAILIAEWLARAWASPLGGLRDLFAGAARFAAPVALAAAALALAQALFGLLPLGGADPTARIEGWRDLGQRLDARAHAEHAPYVLTRGYALTSLMNVYGDPDLPIVQPDERLRWIFEPAPPDALFVAPGLAIGEAGKGFGDDLKRRFRVVESEPGLLRERNGATLAAYEVYRVAEPFAPVLEPMCSGC